MKVRMNIWMTMIMQGMIACNRYAQVEGDDGDEWINESCQ